MASELRYRDSKIIARNAAQSCGNNNTQEIFWKFAFYLPEFARAAIDVYET